MHIYVPLAAMQFWNAYSPHALFGTTPTIAFLDDGE
jgi:hypothetical protein